MKQEMCSCGNELEIIFEQYNKDEVSISELSSRKWQNDHDFFAIDRDNNLRVDEGEVERNSMACTTTYDAFDRDGDGVTDKEDEFPDDPNESKDKDGDGVGDNADILASVPNDLVYSSAGIVGAILILVLAFMLVGNKRGGSGPAWEEEQFDERMMGMEPPTVVPPAMDLGPVPEVPTEMVVSDLFE